MKILISNDDGIFAPGIAALVSAFAKAGHEVYAVAPDSQRSAASHSMTLFKPLTAKETALEGAEKAWAIDGTPVDCVKLAVKTLARMWILSSPASITATTPVRTFCIRGRSARLWRAR